MRGRLAGLLIIAALGHAGCALPRALPPQDRGSDGADASTDGNPAGDARTDAGPADGVPDRMPPDGSPPDEVPPDEVPPDGTATDAAGDGDAGGADAGPDQGKVIPFCDPEDLDLYGCYEFERDETPAPFDGSRFGNHGSETELDYSDEGIAGTALQLNGSPIVLPLMASLHQSPAWSAELWVNPDALPPSGESSIIIDQDAGWSMSLQVGGDLRCCVPTAAVESPCTLAEGALLPGAWRHVGCTYDGASVRLYVDGQLVEETSATGTIISVNAEYGLGYDDPQGGSFFLGRIDQFRLYRAARTQEQICAAAGVSGGDCDPQ